MKGFKKLLGNRENKRSVDSRRFDHFILLEEFQNKMDSFLEDSKLKLDGVLSNTRLETYYEQFLSNPNIFPKSVENFYSFFIETAQETKEYPMPLGAFVIELTTFMEKYYLNKIITNFLNGQHQEYSSNYTNFFLYIKEKDPFILDVLDHATIKKAYEIEYMLWMERIDKNAFGMDKKDVDKHLKEIFKPNGIGDGSFLYAWNSSHSSGIEKYNKAAENDLYKQIKTTERQLYKYLFSVSDTGSKISSREIDVLQLVRDAKSLVELGPGGTNKLQEYLGYYPHKKGIADLLNDKKICLVDVNADGYIGVKKELNKINQRAIIEGIESNFFDASSSAYKTEKPCYFMFGGTVGNFSLEKFNTLLDSIKSKEVFSSTGLFVTYFHTPDKNKLSPEAYAQEVNKVKAMYGDNESNPFFNMGARESKEDFVLSGLEALGLDRNKLEYVVEYEEGDRTKIKLGARLKEDISIKTSDNILLSKKAGEYLRALPSARFTEEEFAKLAKDKDYTVIKQQSHNGVGVAVLKSKIALNDKYKKRRNMGYETLIALTFLASGVAIHKHQDNSKATERTEQHEKDILHKQGIGVTTANYYNSLTGLSSDLTDRFITRYGQGDFSREEVQEEIRLYLNNFSTGKEWYTKLIKGGLFEQDAFLYAFVDEYFYKQMFKNGFESLEAEAFLRGLESDFIKTLTYTGPIHEGFNELTNTYTEIHSPTAIDAQGIDVLDGLDLVSGQIFEHKGHVSTITVYGTKYQQDIATSQDVILLSQTKPDKDYKVTIKRFIFDEHREEREKRVRSEGKKIIFINNHNKTAIHGHKNLIVAKDEIIKIFEKEDNGFTSCWELFLTLNNYRNITIDPKYFPELKRLMIIDLYSKNKLGLQPISRIKAGGTTQIIGAFIADFQRNHVDFIKRISQKK